MNKTSILLVEDHALVRGKYRTLLEQDGDLHVIAEACNAQEAVRLFCLHRPDVVVMDLSLPGESGLSAMQRILSEQGDAKVLIFSLHEDATYVRSACRQGSKGYVTKAQAPEVIVTAVRQVAAGNRYFSHDVASYGICHT